MKRLNFTDCVKRWFQLCVNTESGHSRHNWKKIRKCFSFYYNCYPSFIISIINSNLIMIFLRSCDNLCICLYALSVNGWNMHSDIAAIFCISWRQWVIQIMTGLLTIPECWLRYFLYQCFSTTGPRPGTGPWRQLYRAARGLRKLQYITRFH